jgi:hypothetical protein
MLKSVETLRNSTDRGGGENSTDRGQSQMPFLTESLTHRIELLGESLIKNRTLKG